VISIRASSSSSSSSDTCSRTILKQTLATLLIFVFVSCKWVMSCSYYYFGSTKGSALRLAADHESSDPKDNYYMNCHVCRLESRIWWVWLSFPVLTIEFDAHPQLLLAAAGGCRRRAGSAQQVDQIFLKIWRKSGLLQTWQIRWKIYEE